MMANLFGIWLDTGRVRTGGDLSFPKAKVSAAVPPTDGMTGLVFNGLQEHCTTLSTTEGRYSVSIMLTRKTWRAALCSHRKLRAQVGVVIAEGARVSWPVHLCVLARCALPTKLLDTIARR
jgi:hypothetical protein